MALRSQLPLRTAALVALATFAYAGYEYLVRAWQLSGVSGPDPTTYALFLLVVAVTVATAVVGRARGLRFAPALAIVALAAWPHLYLSTRAGGAAHTAIPMTAVLAPASVEWLARSRNRVRAALGDRAVRLALVVGGAHAVVGLLLEAVARENVGALVLALAVGVPGLFVTGALPAYAYLRRRLVLPLVVLASWLALGLVELWRARASLPWGAFDGYEWVAATPSIDYALGWTGLLLWLLVALGLELLARRLPVPVAAD